METSIIDSLCVEYAACVCCLCCLCRCRVLSLFDQSTLNSSFARLEVLFYYVNHRHSVVYARTTCNANNTFSYLKTDYAFQMEKPMRVYRLCLQDQQTSNCDFAMFICTWFILLDYL